MKLSDWSPTVWDGLTLLSAVPYTIMGPALTAGGGDDLTLACLVKCLPMMVLLIWAMSARYSRQSGVFSFGFVSKALLIAAIWFSGAGDWALVYESHFVAGVQYFRLSHLAYIALFARDMTPSSFGALIAFTVLVGALTTLLPVLPADLIFTIPSYSLAIVIMFYTAFCTNVADARTVTFGALCFMLSDFVLSLNKFIFPFAAAHYIVHCSYYLSQLCLTRGVILRDQLQNTPVPAKQD